MITRSKRWANKNMIKKNLIYHHLSDYTLQIFLQIYQQYTDVLEEIVKDLGLDKTHVALITGAIWYYLC